MYNIVLAVHIVFAIAMIGLILIQHGKGADAGASFGAGASGTVFGAAGSANFLSRATAVLAGLFFITSLSLAAFARKEAADQLRLDVVDTAPVTAPAHTPTSVPTSAMSHSPAVAPTTTQALTPALGESAVQEQTAQSTETATTAESDTQSAKPQAESAPTNETPNSETADKSAQTTEQTANTANGLDNVAKPVFSETDTSNASADKK